MGRIEPGGIVDLATFAAARAAGAIVIDVRQPFEYRAGHIPGSHSRPLPDPGDLAELTDLAELGDQVPATPVFLVCSSGRRSSAAARALAEAGHQAYALAGGVHGWAAQGRPLRRGR